MFAETDGKDILLRIKAVPNASRDQIAGLIGDHLKVRVAAPPEGGKANTAICRLVATSLRIRPSMVTVAAGRSSLMKVLRIRGVTFDEVHARLPS